jgi:enolase
MSGSSIRRIHAREVLDSRGRPTIEAEVELAGGSLGVASVPAGASRGRYEALELRDRETRFGGYGVRRAVENVSTTIAAALAGRDGTDQTAVDQLLMELDGTEDKSNLGANALLAVSLASARAGAAASALPLWRYLAGGEKPRLPLPMVNIISGGLHARRSLDLQDFLAVPLTAASYSDALAVVCGLHGAVEDLLIERGLTTLRADEGGFAPPLRQNRAALELLTEAARRAQLVPGEDVGFAIDVAATHFYDRSTEPYELSTDRRSFTAEQLAGELESWLDDFPIVSLEDPLSEDDWGAWATFTARLGGRLQLVGDDLFATSLGRLERGIENGVANAVLVKMNQVGTLTETLRVIGRARAVGYRTIVSARSGETEDPFIADLAVATGAGQIKIGSVTQSERLAKYNQLLRIEEALGDGAVFAGATALAGTPRVFEASP